MTKLGVENYLTRKTDIDLELTERVRIAEEHKANYFISIHHNALPDSRDPNQERGFSCHYYHEESYEFSKYVANKLNEFSGLEFSGIYRQNLHVLRENKDMKSLLLEMGFLIHPLESELISSPEFQDKNSKIRTYGFS